MFQQAIPKKKKKVFGKKKSPGKKRALDSDSPSPRKRKRKRVKKEPEPPKEPSKYPDTQPYCLKGKNVNFQGDFPDWKPDELRNLVVRCGGKFKGFDKPSMMTHYLITGAGLDLDAQNALENKHKVLVMSLARLLDLLPTLPEQAAPTIRTRKPKTEDLWVDLFNPKSSKDLVGNKTQIKKIQKYLKDWDKMKNQTGKGAKKERACLLSGPPGIGKSSAAHIIAKEMGFEVLEFNASDARGKKALQSQAGAAIMNRSMSEFATLGGRKKPQKPTLIIMDEVDGLSGSDRGGNAQMCQFIKTTKRPIICICNDRQKDSVRTLANYCIDCKFSRPKAEEIAERMYSIAKARGFSVSRETLMDLANGVNRDLRQCLNLLQMWSLDPEDKKFDSREVKNRMQLAKKDLTTNTWEVVPKFWTMHRDVPMKDRIYRGLEWFFVDFGIIPLFVFENYLRVPLKEPEEDVLKNFADAAESMADADLMEARMRKSQDYGVLPAMGTLACTRPAILTGPARGNLMSKRPTFPNWLGKNSSRRKKTGLLTDVCTHMNRHVTGSNSAVLQDYFPLLRKKMSDPILAKGVEGLMPVIEVMKAYGLCREDWDTIVNDLALDLADFIPGEQAEINIKAQIKVKFTKLSREHLVEYNRSSMAPDAGQTSAKSKKNKFIKQKKVPKKKKKRGTKKKATKARRKTKK